VETVEAFRLRARAWLAANLPRFEDIEAGDDPEDDADWVRNRELQKRLHAGGFAGICFPREYGGLGLTLDYQEAFNQEAAGYEMPLRLNIPTFSICAPTILDMGSEQQKRDRIGGALRGEEVLVQLLSEPSGGSDLAGVITRAERDGDTWVLNGAKTWSTSAYAADWGLCLARTDWEAPKHRGLTMFLVPIRAAGITLRRIRMTNGANEFCEEFFDDVILPADAVVGEVNEGWAVASRQLVHERTAVGGGSPYMSGRRSRSMGVESATPLDIARRANRLDDPAVREDIGAWHVQHRVHEQLVARLSAGMKSGLYPPPAASMMRLMHAEVSWLTADIGLRVGGSQAVAYPADESKEFSDVGRNWLMRQGGSLGGGSTEMARNIISERVLGMPREYAADRDVPFSQVRRSGS
jgi:alkylation response protein AidB-like acyl-CoA dehydrogenase